MGHKAAPTDRHGIETLLVYEPVQAPAANAKAAARFRQRQ
jgi:hypothetical protein